ncbi:MAG: serine hydrolase domain-containing protein [Bacteroidia bacterium]
MSCSPLKVPPTGPCPTASSLTINPDHPKAAALQAEMDAAVKAGIPGLSVLIDDADGTWMGSAGYADIENGIVMQPCHINKLGSVTKMMVGALVWQLIQDGKLEISTPISTYIPEVASQLPNGAQITLAQLLNHTAGVFDIAGDLNFNLAVVNDLSRSWTEEEILKFIEGKEAVHAPGEEVSYSNTHTLLVGLIIESVTGRQHGELLQERIFDPLGMSNTVYYDYLDDFPLEHVAQGYLDFNNDGGDIQNISALNPASGNGYTGVYSTVEDLYKFMNALLREKTLTTPENLDYIFTTFQGQEDEERYSYPCNAGFFNEFRDILSAEKPAYGHSGGDIGYAANLNYLPQNNTVFAATYNYGLNLPSPLRARVVETMQNLIQIIAE